MRVRYPKKKNILIYGAGEAGRQLVTSLENNSEFKVIGFLDDNEKLQEKVLLGQTIYSLPDLKKLLITKEVSLVFLAMPSIARNKRNQIIKKLNQYKLAVKTLPSISEIIDGRVTVSDIKDFTIEDLLNREQVQPNLELLSQNIKSKVISNYQFLTKVGSDDMLEAFIPILKPDCVPQWIPFLDHSEKAVNWLRNRGVGASRWPWHELPSEVKTLEDKYPNSCELDRKLMLLPVHQSLKIDDLEKMSFLISEFRCHLRSNQK